MFMEVKKMSENILSMKNVTKKFAEFELKDINLEIEKGTIVGLVGENGAGKTTLVKMILNIYGLDQGTIKVMNKDHVVEEIFAKNQIGYVSDESYLYYNASLIRYSKLFEDIYDEWDQDLFNSLVEKWNLPLYKLFNEYSKGMKRLAMFTLALCHHPKLLILDESTAGLDPVVRMEFLDMIRDFTADGEHSVLFSSHITSDLDKVADYVAMIEQGKIIENTSIDELEEKYVMLTGTNNIAEEIEQTKCNLIGLRKGNMNFEALVLRSELSKLPSDINEKLVKKTPNIENIVTSLILNERSKAGK